MSHLFLIADDNSDNILLMRRLIRRLGKEFECIEAQTGRETYRLAAERNPDLILLDMKMPDMDGYETAAALKSNKSTSNIPVIAVTAQAMLGDRERALEAGCDDYLTKPIDPVLLVMTLKKYISGEPSTGE